MGKYVKALMMALIFVAVWFLSIAAVALIGAAFGIADAKGMPFAVFAFSVLIIPVVLGFWVAKQWGKKHKVVEKPYKENKEPHHILKKYEHTGLRKKKDDVTEKQNDVKLSKKRKSPKCKSPKVQDVQEAKTERKMHSREQDILEYRKITKSYNRRSYGIVMLCFAECLFLIPSVMFILLAPPIGVAMLVGCFFFLKLIIKVGKKNSALWKVIKEYRAMHRSPSLSIDGDTTYCFIAPFSTQTTIAKIEEVLAHVGEVTKTDLLHSIVEGKIQVDPKRTRKVAFYIERSDSECKVRAVFKKLGNDDWWDFFLQELFDSSPGVGYGVSLANGAPQLAAVLHLGDETRQVSYSKTTGGRSLGGFLVGGALFGTAGAVVGGLSGKQRTVTHTNTVYSSTLLVRIIYNNGRLWEGTVHKGSNLYNEIMVNL